ncbi:hypothetical protein IKF15_02660 [Candidatus Saccharibacteria bacterium]|nr:hypothetical protein [Candidatus Saccharibacteria bacterium]
MNQSSCQTPIHEPIEVDATFSRQFIGHCKPLAFRRKAQRPPCGHATQSSPRAPDSSLQTLDREVQITEIGLVHPKYTGLKTLFAFDVTDGTNDYRLTFDSETLTWFLDFEGDSLEKGSDV